MHRRRGCMLALFAADTGWQSFQRPREERATVELTWKRGGLIGSPTDFRPSFQFDHIAKFIHDHYTDSLFFLHQSIASFFLHKFR
jgi:hypothetical protein